MVSMLLNKTPRKALKKILKEDDHREQNHYEEHALTDYTLDSKIKCTNGLLASVGNRLFDNGDKVRAKLMSQRKTLQRSKVCVHCLFFLFLFLDVGFLRFNFIMETI